MKTLIALGVAAALVIVGATSAQPGFAAGDVAFEGDVHGTALMSTGARCSLGEWQAYDSNYNNGTDSATASFRPVTAPNCDLWELAFTGSGGGTVDPANARASVDYTGTLTTLAKPVPGSWDPRLVDGYHSASAYATIWDEVSVSAPTTLVIHVVVDSSGSTTRSPATMQPANAKVLASVDVSPADPFLPGLLYSSTFYPLNGATTEYCSSFTCGVLGHDTQVFQVDVPAGVVRISAQIRVDALLRNAGLVTLGERRVEMAGAIGMSVEAPSGVTLTSRDGVGGVARWNTPAGASVAVSPASPVDIVFDNVSQGGETSVSSSPIGPAIPHGFEILGAFYDVTTTAVFERAQVCLAVDPAVSPRPALLHYENDAWADVTDPSLGDTSHVCGFVTSFSPFVLAREAVADVTPPELSCSAADGGWHADNVALPCSATDAGSGLADPADGSFSLVTSVGAGEESANATTGSRSVCDKVGNCATAGPIAGNKVDRRAPALTVPVDMTASATGPGGASVSFTTTATDGGALAGSSCSPASGTTFAIGSTAVTCTATDAAGNSTTRSFTIKIRGAVEQIMNLIDKTLAILNAPSLEATLRQRLEAAVSALVGGKKSAACGALNVYITAVRFAPTTLVSAAQKSDLIADATRIRAVLGC